MRYLALMLFWLVTAFTAVAGETNYTCVICGQGPLSGRIWIAKWGAVCNGCYQLENHCSICGLPIGKDSVSTADGRFICKFDKPNAVLDVAEAKEVFTDTRRELIGLFGPGLALNYPEVSVNLFDVDYWSEKGAADGLHKFGFSNTRKTGKGVCTHQVVLLSGRSRAELAATAAHEYTHLWINENCPASHVIDGNTVEAICELIAYKLVESRSQKDLQQRILNSTYTHGEITNLVAVEKINSVGYVLNWVKNSPAPNFNTPAQSAPVSQPPRTPPPAPAVWPESLKVGGLMVDGPSRRAVISGISFAAGETKPIRLAHRTLSVKCREIRRDEVVLEVAGLPGLLTMQIGEEKFVP